MLAGVSSAFFGTWGIGTLACTVLADRIGLRTLSLGLTLPLTVPLTLPQP